MKGKIALVTGGSSGIGLATVQALAREGAIVILASRNEKRAHAAMKSIDERDSVSWIAGAICATMRDGIFADCRAAG